MLMVVCGAGASWDSANFDVDAATAPWRPPIGQGLFANNDFYGSFIDRYGQVRPLVHRFRGAKDSVTLEAELERLQDLSKGRPRYRQQLTALRYYLQRVISGTCQVWSDKIRGNTNYVRLIDDIDAFWTDVRKTPVVYVTFNYDVLLDGALGQLGLSMTGIANYIAHPRVKLIKPHGSVNWFHRVDVPNKNSHPYHLQIIPAIDDLTIDPGFFYAPEMSDIEDIPGVPALSIPVAKKTEFEMPPEHLEVLKDAIPKVTHLLVIGWRGNEQAFVDMLLRGLNRERLTSLVVSGRSSSAKAVADALNLANVSPYVSAGGFSTLLGGRELTDFLSRN
jgi:hypothetical protein